MNNYRFEVTNKCFVECFQQCPTKVYSSHTIRWTICLFATLVVRFSHSNREEILTYTNINPEWESNPLTLDVYFISIPERRLRSMAMKSNPIDVHIYHLRNFSVTMMLFLYICKNIDTTKKRSSNNYLMIYKFSSIKQKRSYLKNSNKIFTLHLRYIIMMYVYLRSVIIILYQK